MLDLDAARRHWNKLQNNHKKLIPIYWRNFVPFFCIGSKLGIKYLGDGDSDDYGKIIFFKSVN